MPGTPKGPWPCWAHCSNSDSRFITAHTLALRLHSLPDKATCLAPCPNNLEVLLVTDFFFSTYKLPSKPPLFWTPKEKMGLASLTNMGSLSGVSQRWSTVNIYRRVEIGKTYELVQYVHCQTSLSLGFVNHQDCATQWTDPFSLAFPCYRVSLARVHLTAPAFPGWVHSTVSVDIEGTVERAG